MDSAHAYVIEQRGEEWCLWTADKSRVLGCHATRGDAEAQERAINAAKHAQDACEILGVEIFRVGTWNDDTYSEADLDAIVEAAKAVGFTPPVKLGHAEDRGAPAVGWVENIRRVGSSLYADLVALPKTVYDAIRARRFDRVSAEVFINLPRNGKTFPRALKALALLGAEIPGVDLRPLHAFLSLAPVPTAHYASYAVPLTISEATPEAPSDPVETPAAVEVVITDNRTETKTMADETHVDEVPVRDGEIVVPLAEIRQLRAQAARVEELEGLKGSLAKSQQEKADLEATQREERIKYRLMTLKIPAFRVYARVFYDLAMQMPAVKTYTLADPKRPLAAEAIVDQWIDDMNRQAETLFRTLSVDTKPLHDPDEPDDAGGKVIFRVSKYQREHPATEYRVALKHVLDADPELKEAYSRS